MRFVRGAFLVLFYAVILVVLAPLVLLGMVFGVRDAFISLGKGVMHVSRAILGIKVELRGLEHIEPGMAYIFMANHGSFLDGPMMVTIIPGSVRVILKRSVFDIPILGWAMLHVGFVPVDRKSAGGGKKSIDRAVGLIRDKGYSFLIFPEGTRTLDGSLGRFRRGGFFLALEAGVPILPATIRGTYELMPKGSFSSKRGTVGVEFHAPIPVEGYSRGNMDELVNKVRDAILGPRGPGGEG